jgi:hypothetical protein
MVSSISESPSPNIIKLSNLNIKIIDLTQTIHESTKCYISNCLELGIEDNIKKKDNKNLFLHCALVYIWNMLVLHRQSTCILYYNQNTDTKSDYKQLIVKILNNIPTRNIHSIYSFEEFEKRLNRNDVDVVSIVEHAKNQNKKNLNKLRMFLNRHGLRHVYDCYFKNYNKVISL